MRSHYPLPVSGLLLIVGLAAPIIGQRPDGGSQRHGERKVIWEGSSSTFLIRWTPFDIRVANSEKPAQLLFSAGSLAQKGLKQYAAGLGSDPTQPKTSFGNCSYERRFKVLSVVGSMMSFEDDEFSSCEKEAHPEADTRFTAVDFRKAGSVAYVPGELNVDIKRIGNVAVLTDFFPDDEIARALLADSLVKKALEFRETSQPPKTLVELIKVFNEEELSIQTNDGCSYAIPKDFITRFAFHHVEDGNVSVRLGLPPDVGACRTMHAELGILLPIPDSLRMPLALAQSGEEGFLMSDGKRLSGGRSTSIEFKLKPSEYMRKRSARRNRSASGAN